MVMRIPAAEERFALAVRRRFMMGADGRAVVDLVAAGRELSL